MNKRRKRSLARELQERATSADNDLAIIAHARDAELKQFVELEHKLEMLEGFYADLTKELWHVRKEHERLWSRWRHRRTAAQTLARLRG